MAVAADTRAEGGAVSSFITPTSTSSASTVYCPAASIGRYSFKQNENGVIMGQTRFGYAFFKNRADYEAFLRRFP